MAKVSLYFLLSLLRDPLSHQGPKEHWTYKGTAGPENWKHHYELCGGEQQSPINIDSTSAVFDPTLTDFVLRNFNVPSGERGPVLFNMTNNGHSANAGCKGELVVEGGGLPGRYRTAGFHFHWGSDSGRGSEHALDNYYYPLELHIVNYAEKYQNLSYAMKQSDGLAVLGVLFEASNTDNEWLEPVVESLAHVKHYGEHRVVKNLQLRRLLPEDTSEFFRYPGSLTTPPCFESVTWTVFARPQKISARQLEALRELLYEDHNEGEFSGRNVTHTLAHHGNQAEPMVDNYRPLQPLRGRQVRRSFTRLSAPPVTLPDFSNTPSQTWQTDYTRSSPQEQTQTQSTKPATKAPPAQHWNPQISPLGGGSQQQTAPDPYSDMNAASKDGTMGSRANNMPVSGGQESAAAIGGIPNLSADGAKQVDLPAKGAHQRTSHTVVEQMPDIKIGSAVAFSEGPASNSDPKAAAASNTQTPSFSPSSWHSEPSSWHSQPSSWHSEPSTVTTRTPTWPRTETRTAGVSNTYAPTLSSTRLRQTLPPTPPPTPPPTRRLTQPPLNPYSSRVVQQPSRGPPVPPVDTWRPPPPSALRPQAQPPQQPGGALPQNQGPYLYDTSRDFMRNVANIRNPVPATRPVPPHGTLHAVPSPAYHMLRQPSPPMQMPQVYLQPFSHPIRIRKPFFYSYYSSRQRGPGSVNYPALAAFSNFDIAGLSELRRR